MQDLQAAVGSVVQMIASSRCLHSTWDGSMAFVKSPAAIVVTAPLSWQSGYQRLADLLVLQIHELLCQFAEEGSTVVRLKGGDPYIFGRGGEEVHYLSQRGIQVYVVPGARPDLRAGLQPHGSHRLGSTTDLQQQCSRRTLLGI